ncbi:MAG: hypothetical protein COS87_02465 [Chloroflexi bacterium CG07_land_8_20_14_0_80_45_17]|nr:MAG: hypothetical protein COS87_02465 [Chloroflexi bacterium CG07_land_8_20_14_0_80_45_17]
MWMIEIKEEPNPFLARVVIAGNWDGNVEVAKGLLEDVYERWPKGKRVNFLITCGGFINFERLGRLSHLDIGDVKNPIPQAVNVLAEEAKKRCQQLLSRDLREKLGEWTDYLTLGIDSFKDKISLTKTYISEPHVELVSLIDLRTNSYYWTGKSYPTPNQEKGLIRISDLKTHFLNLDIGKVMILGCHDLTIFNNRNWEKTGEWRKKIKTEFRNLARVENPTIVLQHPHTTDSILTWAAAWNELKRTLPTVKEYASAGRYYNPDNPSQERSKLVDVLARTKSSHTIDFIVHIK